MAPGLAHDRVPAPEGGTAPLRVAMLTYRGHPHTGGQGVYVQELSAALADRGHRVDVLSGPPYPDLDSRVQLVRLPSLELYRPDDPFRPHRRPSGATDLLEWSAMSAGVYPEPLTFSLRALRWIAGGRYRYDVVHDNQVLGYGLLPVSRRVPVVATVHHAITIDRRIVLESMDDPKAKSGMRRWFGFVRMQQQVARRLPRLIVPTEAGRRDVARELGLHAARLEVVHNGVDPDRFRRIRSRTRVPGRILSVCSADVPLKALGVLMDAVAKLRAERPDVSLVSVCRPSPSTLESVRRLGLDQAVTFEPGVSARRLLELYSEAEVLAVPSLYEGFCLPAVEAMSCGLPVVATDAGAMPEVVGDAGVLVAAGDSSALASGLGRVLASEALRRKLRSAGRKRVLDRFTWTETARNTEAVYLDVIAGQRPPSAASRR
ncbi:MAG TPA: glycosyltransferase family 4 protein [Actinomycetota bacterium]|nr:glycosyltransferase family 4 protein [Actinomycetota bacterium]